GPERPRGAARRGLPRGRAARSALAGGALGRGPRAPHAERLRLGVQPGHRAREPARGRRAEGHRAAQSPPGHVLPSAARRVRWSLARRAPALAGLGRAGRRGRRLRASRAGPRSERVRVAALAGARRADPLSGRAPRLDGHEGARGPLPDRRDGRGREARGARSRGHPGEARERVAHRGSPPGIGPAAPRGTRVHRMTRTLTIACAALAALLVLESPALAQDGGAPRAPVQAEDAPRVRSDGGVPVRRVRPRPAPAAPEAATPDSSEPASPAAP